MFLYYILIFVFPFIDSVDLLRVSMTTMFTSLLSVFLLFALCFIHRVIGFRVGLFNTIKYEFGDIFCSFFLFLDFSHSHSCSCIVCIFYFNFN